MIAFWPLAQVGLAA
jgi:hypothetical protein